MKRSLLAIAITTASLGGLVACNNEEESLQASGNINALLLSTTGELVAIDVDRPDRNVRFARISGLAAATTTTAAEQIVDIDYRNADGSLYGLSNQNRLYLIDPLSGGATLVSRLRNAANTADYNLADNASYTIDFNPVADRLRIIGSNGDNLRVDVLTGQVIVDSPVNGGSAGTVISGAAYTDTFGSTGRGTQLFTLDAVNDQLYLQNPPNAGTQSAAISLGVNASSVQGYDIVPATGKGYAILTAGGKTRLYRIDQTATGNAATAISDRLPGDVSYRSLAMVTTANPTVLGLSDNNQLYQFTAANPAVISTATGITLPAGAPAGETLLGIDFRQSDRTLYGLSSAGRIYSINLTAPTAPATTPVVGAATLMSTLVADPSDTSAPFTGLTAASYSIDFNPTVPGGSAPFPDQNRLRIIGSDQSNAVAVIDSGLVTTQASVTPATSTVTAAAYSNNFRGTLLSSLLVIDRTTGSLASQSLSASGTTPEGTLTAFGSLGISPTGRAGFDISGRANENVLLAARTTASGPLTLYRVLLLAGDNLASAVDQIGGASGPGNLVDIAIRQ